MARKIDLESLLGAHVGNVALVIGNGIKRFGAPGVNNPRSAYQNAVDAGANAVLPPIEKPLGQIVGYVRDIDGCLVEICSPIAA